jgi:hypothetical protein
MRSKMGFASGTGIDSVFAIQSTRLIKQMAGVGDRARQVRGTIMQLRNVRQTLLVCAAITLAGCGDGRPERVPVSGTVLIDGQPLTRGYVKFVPADGRPSLGKLGDDGKFALTCFDGGDGAIPGTHRVQVSANRIISANKIEWYAPRKYADFRTSEIEIQVVEPVDNLTIELTSGGRKMPYIEGS